MNIRKRSWATAIGGLATVAVIATAAHAAGFFTNGVPPAGGTQYPSTIPLTGNELVPADTQLASGLIPQSEAISTAQLAGYVGGLPATSNVLIGGDATTNLFQRGTTGSSVTTTVTYGGPDRWAYWSGTSTAMTVSQDSTTTDVPAGYKYAFKMARTSGQTGVVQMCKAQEVETVNAIGLAGNVVELDFNAYTGANFSAASPLYSMTAYIVTGTGTDEGMTKLAYGLNGGGGGSSGWTGQANATAAVISLGGVSTAGRYGAFASIPTTATEVGVVLCYTPTGTAGTNDYVAFSGIQLKPRPQSAAYVSTTVGYNSATAPLAAFERRSQQVETALQQRYFYSITEPATGIPVAMGVLTSTTSCALMLPLPTVMRAAPVTGGVTFTGTALSTSTFRIQDSTTSTLASTFLVFGNGATSQTLGLTATLTTASTAGWGCQLQGAGGGAIVNVSTEL